MTIKPFSINNAPASSTQGMSHAIVIGGSMAGLLAARVLTEHFARVTIIERDQLPTAPEIRNGVPQARHAHSLWIRGRSILEQYFPGLIEELRVEGAVFADVGKEVAWLSPMGWEPRYTSDMVLMISSRSLLEWRVRQRLVANPQVSWLTEHDVIGLLPGADGRRVIGVRTQRRGQHRDVATTPGVVYADLVIDASGRSSKAPRWLEALGHAAPQETVVDAQIGYASRIYAIPPGFQFDWKAIYLQSAPPHEPRMGILFTVEGNRWLVTLSGVNDDRPPTDEDGFLAFMRNLRSPLIYDVLKEATPLSPIYGYGNTANCWRHYEVMPGRTKRRPEGFVVMGDALCAFNPVYGQGMTVAALESLTLAEVLRAQRRRYPNGELRGFARCAQKALAKVVKGPWTFATGEDYRYLAAAGAAPTSQIRFMHWYLDQIMRLTTHDRVVHRLFLELLNMLESPSALFRPRIITKVLIQAVVGHKFGSQTIGRLDLPVMTETAHG